ncbi:hypothetical protein BDW72DRAFT_85692 [Aspergillus terricola var. indicus]
MCYSVVLVCFLTALYFLYAISFPFSLFPLIPALARTIDYPLHLKILFFFLLPNILYCLIPTSSPFAVEINIYLPSTDRGVYILACVVGRLVYRLLEMKSLLCLNRNCFHDTAVTTRVTAKSNMQSNMLSTVPLSP